MSGILFGTKKGGIYKNIVVENNTVSSNLNGVQIKAGAAFTNLAINRNNIVDNVNYGIENLAAGTVDATENWWGSTNGPCHPTENPFGQGNEVSGNVDFKPYSESSF